MKLGIMQPYFFPYLGYFHLINQVDRWIVFDTPQYIRHGWINRNRVLHPNKGWQHIIVPVHKHPRETLIKDVRIANEKDWRRLIIAQLGHYKKKAPYYTDTIQFLDECLACDGDSISDLNVRILERTCEHLGIAFRYDVFSQMPLELGAVDGPGDWALRISEAVGATEYVNPSGADFFDQDKYRDSGIRLTMSELPPMAYECRGYEYVPNLSIVDILMWLPPDEIKSYLDDHV